MAVGRIAATANLGFHETRLVVPMDVAPFGFGPLFERRILSVELLLDGLPALLIGALDWLLRREPTAFERVADFARPQPEIAISLFLRIHESKPALGFGRLDYKGKNDCAGAAEQFGRPTGASCFR